MTTKSKAAKEGLLVPKEVAGRALGEGSEEVEIFEEPGRLLIVAGPGTHSSEDAEGRSGPRKGPDEDPILGLGGNPVRTGARGGSTDRYLYGAGG